MIGAFPLAACAMPIGPPPPIGPSAPSAPTSAPGGDPTDALIYAGDGSWPAEVDSLASILYAHHASYREVSSSELDAMSADELAHFKLLIFPGGGTQARSPGASAQKPTLAFARPCRKKA